MTKTDLTFEEQQPSMIARGLVAWAQIKANPPGTEAHEEAQEELRRMDREIAASNGRDGTEKFTLSLTSDELNWLFEDVFPLIFKDIQASIDGAAARHACESDAICVMNNWKTEAFVQGYRLTGLRNTSCEKEKVQ